MNIEIAPSRLPSGVGPVLLDTASDASRVIAILDGTGSWEAGDAEAQAVAKVLRATWYADVPSSAGEVIRAVVSAMQPADASSPAETFGRPGFSFVAAIARGDGVSLVSCGSHAVLHLQDAVAHVLYRPLFWIDEQVAAGTLTREEARLHQLRHVYTGPLVSRNAPPLFSDAGPIRAGRIVIATMELARTLLDRPVETWSRERAEAIQNMEQDGAAQVKPVVVVDLDGSAIGWEVGRSKGLMGDRTYRTDGTDRNRETV